MNKESKQVTKNNKLKRTVTPEKGKKKKRRQMPSIPKKYEMIIQTTNYNKVVGKDGKEVIERQ